MCLVLWKDKLENSPNPTRQQPHQAKHPSNRSITAEGIPAEDKVEGEGSTVDDRRKEDKSRGGDIVGDLKEEDLPDNLQRGKVGSRARSRGPAARGHELFIFCV